MKSDSELRQAVLEELEWEPSVTSAEVGVTVKDGVVTLTGWVESHAEKTSAYHAAARVFGVRAVADDLKVRLSDYNERTDSDIARSAANAIAWTSTVPQDCVKVIVEDGWLTLEGKVNWRYEKDAAEAAVRSLRGVVGVSNEIVVEPLIEKLEVKSKIEKAFERNAHLKMRKISVDADGTRIILRGKVHSFLEREEAERAAWSTPGVTGVENNLVVQSE